MLLASSLNALLVSMALMLQPASPAELQALWDAAQAGDRARVAELLERGVGVDAATRYGATALWFAADKGHLEVVRLLLERGASVEVQDAFYERRPLDMALGNGHFEVARVLLEQGSTGAASALTYGIQAKDVALVRAALIGRDLTPASLNNALARAMSAGHEEITALIKARAATISPPPAVAVERAVLETYLGTYGNDASRLLTVTLPGDRLVAEGVEPEALTLVATGRHAFRSVMPSGFDVTFYGRAGQIQQITVTQPTGETYTLPRVTNSEPLAAATGGRPQSAAAPSVGVDAPSRAAPRSWPAFRGAGASGNGDGQDVVAEWDVATGENIKWKTPIPGLATSSPIVWGDRVFVTTAISLGADSELRTRSSGPDLTDRVRPLDDLSEHAWKIYCLDKVTGEILWERTAFQGPPAVKRHPKSTQANSTPVTDGTHVVALFGTVGLLSAYDIDGQPLWTRDLGEMDSGWFMDPTYEWGHASSPIIYQSAVIVQGDRQEGSFLAAYDLATGKELWRTERDEISTWGTPTIVRGGRDELITNGPIVRAYDPRDGDLLWTLGPNSEITIATPVAGNGLVYVTGGYPPVQPIYAIRLGAVGDLSLPEGRMSSEAVAWSTERGGAYIPTPLLYRGFLYLCANNGVVTVYEAESGKVVHRLRVGGGGTSFSASPIAADGRLYLASEDGDVYVINTGAPYEELAKNEMDEMIMATPAVSDGLMVVRTLSHVYGIGR